MKIKVNSAELAYYNANARGKRVGDCVKRSMSLAFDMSYNEVGKYLNEKMKEKHADKWNISRVYSPVIQELGGSSIINMKEPLTVNEFADEVAEPGKAYLVVCGDKFPSRGHMVCIRDKKIWDSWNSKDQFVSCYYVVNNTKPLKEITNIKEQIVDITKEYAGPILKEEIEKYMYKKDWEGHYEFRGIRDDYAIKYLCQIVIDKDVYITKDRKYSFTISLVFEPTMTEEDAVEYAKKTAKVRIYDRLYAIGKQEEKLVEAAKMKAQAGLDSNDYMDVHYTTDQEKRFVNSLPGWIRPLIRYINIQMPGMYSDSYRLTILPRPDDTLHSSDTKIEFEGMTANEIKWEIDRYQKTFEAPFIDYYPADEF